MSWVEESMITLVQCSHRCIRSRRAENTPLWYTGAESDGGGQVGSQSDYLGTVCEELLDPCTDGAGEVQVTSRRSR